MAKSGLQVTNGALNLPTGFLMDSQTMRVHEHQDAQNVTAYPAIGGTPTTYGIFRGSGTPLQDISVTGFPFKGGGGSPGFGKMTPANTGDLGTAATFQFDTSVTIAGNYIATDVAMDHSRLVAGARSSINLLPSSDLTVVWA